MTRVPPFDYAPVTDRPYELPSGNRVAFWVIPNIECYRFDVPYPNTDSDYVPQVLDFSWRDYGTRVGVWRLMEVLDEHDVRATVALNAGVCDHAPEVVEAGMDRDWEFMGHGVTNSVRLSGLTEDEERTTIRETRSRIEEFTGRAPAGWLGPGLAETFETPRLLAEEGFDYLCDWVNDDQPYRMEVDGEALVSIPYTTEINDIPMFTRRNWTGGEFEATVRDQFDVLYEEGGREGNAKVMAMALHPHITGQPHRSKYLDRVLEYITGHDDVWVTTGGEIADHFAATYL